MEVRQHFLKIALDRAKNTKVQVRGDFLILFHGTSESTLKKIVKSGKFKSGTFFARDYDTAMSYARGLGGKPIVTMAVMYAGALFPTTEYWTSNEEMFQRNGTYQPIDLINNNLKTS